MNRRRHRRRGAVLVAALVSMLLVMAMLASMLQGTLRARRQLHVARDLRQTELLLQAGAERAALRLARDDAYRGETWTLPAAAFAGRAEAQVTTEASRESDQAPWQVRVVAEFPLGSDASIRRSREFHIPPSSLQVQE